MIANVELRRAELGDILPKYEWQVVRIGSDWIVFVRQSMRECAEWMVENCSEDYDYKLQRVRVDVRPSLTDAAKRAMELIVREHGRHEKVRCIKDVRMIFRVGLKEAKELVEDYLAETEGHLT